VTVVRLLVTAFGGDVTVDTDDGTAVTVHLRRTAAPDDDRAGSLAGTGPGSGTRDRTGFGVAAGGIGLGVGRPDGTVDGPTAPGDVGPVSTAGVAPARLLLAVPAALLAGVGMGVVLQATVGTLAVIGTLYGVAAPGVGWVLHLFHSVVFGMGFVVLLSALDREALPFHDRREGSPGVQTVALAVGYGVLLWLVAAGVVMPLWLSLVGVPTPVPTLSTPGLVAHALWGSLLGGSYAALARWRG
jgi:uncharacterized membrane protein YagU involved in acid resistance